MNDDYTITDLTSMEEILKMAIRRAEDSHAFNNAAAARAQLRTTRELFTRMAEEELAHKYKLKKELEELLAQREIDEAISGEAY